MTNISQLLEINPLHAKQLLLRIAYSLLLVVAVNAHSAMEALVPVSAEVGTGIAGDLFPVTIKLPKGNIFLTSPALLFLNAERIGMQVRLQVYDNRPAEGIAMSEMGHAMFSGKIGYDPATRQVLLYDPQMDKLVFDRKSGVTKRLFTELQAAWTAQVTNPIRADFPPHAFLLPFRNNVTDISYDGVNINLKVNYQ